MSLSSCFHTSVCLFVGQQEVGGCNGWQNGVERSSDCTSGSNTNIVIISSNAATH